MRGVIVVCSEIYGISIDISKHFPSDTGHANFGVTHGCRRVAVDRAKIPLSIDEGITQGKLLRHTDDGVVDGDIAMGMIFTDYITNDTS